MKEWRSRLFELLMATLLAGLVINLGYGLEKTLKNIPTLAIKDGWTEENYADFGLVSGPLSKNEDILVLEKIITETLKDRTVRENLTKIGIVASDLSSSDYRNLQTEQKNRYIRLIKK
jgi:hypothetical protein